MRPKPITPGKVVRWFTRRREKPRGVVWFGVRSFWGHIRHFIASAIATEDVDSRDWMAADDPQQLAARVARLLGAQRSAGSVTESLGRDVWVDFVADTGDDAAVSGAVAKLLFSEYELPDPQRSGAFLRAPRGDILFFGGDTAYPVATADEIANRVLVPFNRVLEKRRDGRRRVLLGIPGNHDWYDGLDGFGRLFRRRVDFGLDGAPRATLHGTSKTMMVHYAAWALEFVRGGLVDKPDTLGLVDYVAVQGASYFALPIAPGVSILAVDRQLKQVDFRQQRYFATWLNQNLAMSPWLVLPDPVYAFGRPSASGLGMIRSLELSLQGRPHFVLSGDIHHYRREEEGPTVLVTAGGGGAFLHPAPLARRGVRPAIAEWPDARQSRWMLWQVPWKVALGRSGILPHLGYAILFAPAVLFGADLFAVDGPRNTVAGGTAVLAGVIYALIGGVRRGGALTAVLAACAGLATGAVPLVAARVYETIRHWLELPLAVYAAFAAVVVLASVVSAFIFGAYLALLTVLGLENTQAFTALDHPGFKHFVRFRVRQDGTAVDGWCIGLSNPLGRDAEPVLVDTFTWRCR